MAVTFKYRVLEHATVVVCERVQARKIMSIYKENPDRFWIAGR
jgi:hypothetical protein